MRFTLLASVLMIVQSGEEASALKPLLGSWEFQTFRLKDDKLDALLAKAVLKIEPGKLTLGQDTGGERWSFRLLPNTSPLGIDLANESGGTFRGIIRTDGAWLEMVYCTERGLDRPEEFKAGVQAKTVYVKFQPIKP